MNSPPLTPALDPDDDRILLLHHFPDTPNKETTLTFHKNVSRSITRYALQHLERHQRIAFIKAYLQTPPKGYPIPNIPIHPKERSATWYVARRVAARAAERLAGQISLGLRMTLEAIPSITTKITTFSLIEERLYYRVENTKEPYKDHCIGLTRTPTTPPSSLYRLTMSNPSEIPTPPDTPPDPMDCDPIDLESPFTNRPLPPLPSQHALPPPAAMTKHWHEPDPVFLEYQQRFREAVEKRNAQEALHKEAWTKFTTHHLPTKPFLGHYPPHTHYDNPQSPEGQSSTPDQSSSTPSKEARRKLEHSWADGTAPPTCANCKTRGHLSVDCPKATKRRQPCAACGVTTHATARCPKNRYCGYCHQFGHYGRVCPNPHLWCIASRPCPIPRAHRNYQCPIRRPTPAPSYHDVTTW
jgi:hypothetical protein